MRAHHHVEAENGRPPDQQHQPQRRQVPASPGNQAKRGRTAPGRSGYPRSGARRSAHFARPYAFIDSTEPTDVRAAASAERPPRTCRFVLHSGLRGTTIPNRKPSRGKVVFARRPRGLLRGPDGRSWSRLKSCWMAQTPRGTPVSPGSTQEDRSPVVICGLLPARTPRQAAGPPEDPASGSDLPERGWRIHISALSTDCV